MYKNGGYAGDDRMCDLVCDRYAVLQVMSRFGIALGFGDKTIAEVCAESRVDAATFLAVVNMLMNFGNGAELAGEVSVRSLTDYLHNSHGYFLDFRLPAIRRKLIEAVDCALSDVSFAIMRFFDEYAAEVQRHMSYEEQTVFPYVESLLSGEKNTAYSIDIFRRQHDQIDIKLRELKNIIIKYYPSGSSNELNGVLFDIFNCEHELASHNAVEDELFIPAVERLAAAPPFFCARAWISWTCMAPSTPACAVWTASTMSPTQKSCGGPFSGSTCSSCPAGCSSLTSTPPPSWRAWMARSFWTRQRTPTASGGQSIPAAAGSAPTSWISSAWRRRAACGSGERSSTRSGPTRRRS